MSLHPNTAKSITPDMIEPLCERIVANVEIDDNECWVWTGNRFKSGYGRIKYKGKQFYAHRVSSELFHDGFDPSLLVCHECPNQHNKACLNPWHLKQGTQKDNMGNEQTRQLLREKALEVIERKRTAS